MRGAAPAPVSDISQVHILSLGVISCMLCCSAMISAGPSLRGVAFAGFEGWVSSLPVA